MNAQNIILYTLPFYSFCSDISTWLSKPGEVGNAVETALKEGYVHVDCAHIYGNEAEIGTVMQKCLTDGVIKREDLFVTSKLWYRFNIIIKDVVLMVNK